MANFDKIITDHIRIENAGPVMKEPTGIVIRDKDVGLEISKCLTHMVISKAGTGILMNDISNFGLSILQSYCGIAVGKCKVGFDATGVDYGIQVGHSYKSGLKIEKSDMNGIDILETSKSGLLVENAYQSGIFINNAKFYGFHVVNAGWDGMLVGHADQNGLLIDYAGKRGVHIRQSKWSGLSIEDAGASGLNIGKAAGHGINIDKSGLNGLNVYEAAYHGVRVKDTALDGLRVCNAGRYGIGIKHSNDDGIRVEETGGDGLYIGNAGKEGLHIGTSNTGIFIEKSSVSGLVISEAGIEGISVIRAGWDGLYVQDAGRYGLCLDNSKNDFIVAGLANRKFQVKQSGRVDSVQGCSVPSCSAELVETKEGSLAGYEPGDVLVISTSKDRTVEKSTIAYSPNVAGIYCEKPGLIGSNHPLEDQTQNEILLAISGIVPCKVTGLIKRGDLLTTSGTMAGHAMKASSGAPQVGSILGKAFGESNVNSGKIDVLVMLR